MKAVVSRNHRLVLDILEEQPRGRHLSMAELYAVARARAPQIGFTTVYRALTRLRDEGLVAEVSLPGAEAAYYEKTAEPHAHFRCTGCGRIDDVCFTLGAEVLSQASTALDAQITGASVALEGVCSGCSEPA
jgi:Fur family ferric uptake transcriptional regulator